MTTLHQTFADMAAIMDQIEDERRNTHTDILAMQNGADNVNSHIGLALDGMQQSKDNLQANLDVMQTQIDALRKESARAFGSLRQSLQNYIDNHNKATDAVIGETPQLQAAE
jgi:cob(I)alamin adenosyltransferase